MKSIKKNIESDEIIWSNLKLRLKDLYGEAVYSNWLKLLTFSKVEKDIVIFYAPTKFMCDWILSHYGKKILSLWIEKNKSIKDITIHVYNDKETKKKNENFTTTVNKSDTDEFENNLDPSAFYYIAINDDLNSK